MLKLMTLNINFYVDKHGPWQKRRELVVKLLSDQKPDIVALQAVKQDPQVQAGQNQALQLAEMLPEYQHLVYQTSIVNPDGSTEGTAFLSRYPLLASGHLPLTLLPDLEDSSRRIVLTGLFKTPLGTLRLFNAHFSWVYQQAALNVQETLPYVQSFDEPFALLGDLNTNPEVDLLDQFRQAQWTDAWEKLCSGEDGFTFEAPNPSIRIDYLWAGPELAKRLAGMAVLSQEAPGGVRLSDHLALLGSLQ